MSPQLVIYGAYGYTGELVVQRALERGLRPLLSGRDPLKLAEVAVRYGLEHRAARLNRPAELDALLRGAHAVLHCAGPFALTAPAMVEACLRGGIHYLDITGEIEVFEALAGRDAQARQAGVMLLPGVGFDVVPSDCLAAHLKRRLPSATHLRLAVGGITGVSHGTATTALLGMGQSEQGGLVRRAGALTRVPLGQLTRTVDLGEGPVLAVNLPLGDVVTAFHSTGIPNIEMFIAAGAGGATALRLSGRLAPLLRAAPVRRALVGLVRRGPRGPSEELRQNGRALLWGQVEDAQGNRAETRLRTPEVYAFTACTAVAAAELVLSQVVRPGFQTPASMYGPDFVLGFTGVTRTDIA